jgi:hypothetical protein
VTAEHATPALLHNMSMRPRTTITATLTVVGAALARFAVDPQELPALLAEPGLRERLEEHWHGLGLRGALHVYPLPDRAALKKKAVVQAGAPLALNVLGRARAGLLLPSAPLDLDPGALARTLAADDPRLVALASAEWER